MLQSPLEHKKDSFHVLQKVPCIGHVNKRNPLIFYIITNERQAPASEASPASEANGRSEARPRLLGWSSGKPGELTGGKRGAALLTLPIRNQSKNPINKM